MSGVLPLSLSNLSDSTSLQEVGDSVCVPDTGVVSVEVRTRAGTIVMENLGELSLVSLMERVVRNVWREGVPEGGHVERGVQVDNVGAASMIVQVADPVTCEVEVHVVMVVHNLASVAAKHVISNWHDFTDAVERPQSAVVKSISGVREHLSGIDVWSPGEAGEGAVEHVTVHDDLISDVVIEDSEAAVVIEHDRAVGVDMVVSVPGVD